MSLIESELTTARTPCQIVLAEADNRLPLDRPRRPRPKDRARRG
jgi:hypothetical protein